MVKVKKALISVSDKSGLAEFAKGLDELGVSMLSTGGTAKLLRENNIKVTDVSEHTGFPEMLDGRVKTLHPKIHGGLLSLRDNPDHMQQVKKHGIELIDMVVVNLYPFEKTIQKEGVKLEEAIENIDIGGPSMLRSAAKNFHSVAVVSNPEKYPEILKELKENDGKLSDETLTDLGVEVFRITSKYDKAIYDYLSANLLDKKEKCSCSFCLSFNKLQDLRYGENPHQKAAVYKKPDALKNNLVNLEKLHGKELSFNNFLDLNTALDIIREFKEPAAVVIKHLNPTGVAQADTLAQAFVDAWKCDSLSAFGGIVGLNRAVDTETANKIIEAGFLECILAPDFDAEAFKILETKKNMRLLKLDTKKPVHDKEFKYIDGGILVQDIDTVDYDKDKLKVLTKKQPSKSEMDALLFAWKVVKHTKSNAIVLARDKRTVGVGMGQTSRVDSVMLSIKRAGKESRGSVLASDAFFPKKDSITTAGEAGVVAIIQPAGSISDEEIIVEADRLGIAMVATGIRHFKH